MCICNRAPHRQNSTPKLAGQISDRISQGAIYHEMLATTSSRYQVFEKHAPETEQRCFSKVILESNVVRNVSRSSHSFNTVPPKINGGDWECIVRYLKTIMISVLLAFNFILKRSYLTYHSLPLPRSRFEDSATTTLTPGGGTSSHQSGVIGITDQIILQRNQPTDRNQTQLRSQRLQQNDDLW